MRIFSLDRTETSGSDLCLWQRGGGTDNDRLVRVLRGDDDAADGGGADGVGRGGTAQAGVPAPPPVSTDFLATEVRVNLVGGCLGLSMTAWSG